MKLQTTLERGLIDSAIRGVSKDELVKALQKRFDVSFSEADRLVRTEMTYIQNQATLDAYKQAGIEEYQYLATNDDRVSEICEDQDGEIYAVNAAIVGVNFPPMHANCRCTIIPIVRDAQSITQID